MKKKSRVPLIVAAVIFLVVILVAVFFGNAITLSVRSGKDIKVFNSGSLDVPGISFFETTETSDFVAELLKENDIINDEDGAIVGTVLPFLEFERVKVNGFLNGNTVDFIIKAPDLGGWLLNLEVGEDYSADDLYEDMVDYLPSAPMKDFPVTVEYYRNGIFDWTGNYKTTEFADALSGGLQSAYSQLYTQAMEELEENLR